VLGCWVSGDGFYDLNPWSPIHSPQPPILNPLLEVLAWNVVQVYLVVES
jgi:hypothetical protein